MTLALPSSRSRIRAFAATAAALLALSGCSFHIGSVTVSKSELEKQVLKMLTPDNPDTTPTVTCDGELKGEKGATQVCHASTTDGTTGLNLTVTSVDGTNVKFKLDSFIAADDVVKAIKKLADDQGITVDTLSCDGDLPGTMGAKIRCTGTPADTVGTLEVSVTDVQGLRVSFDVNPVS